MRGVTRSARGFFRNGSGTFSSWNPPGFPIQFSVRAFVCLCVRAFVPRKGFSLALYVCFGIRL